MVNPGPGNLTEEERGDVLLLDENNQLPAEDEPEPDVQDPLVPTASDSESESEEEESTTPTVDIYMADFQYGMVMSKNCFYAIKWNLMHSRFQWLDAGRFTFSDTSNHDHYFHDAAQIGSQGKPTTNYELGRSPQGLPVLLIKDGPLHNNCLYNYARVTYHPRRILARNVNKLLQMLKCEEYRDWNSYYELRFMHGNNNDYYRVGHAVFQTIGYISGA